MNIIKRALHDNNYNINKVIKQPISQKQNTDIDSQHRKTKWATLHTAEN
jgi:hypothetical protein